MPDPDINKSNILVVDDEREHAQVMCEALTRLGHKCDVTYNLAEAQAKLDDEEYDVVVTDLMMDGRRDGLEVLHVALQKQSAAAGRAGDGARGHPDLQAGAATKGRTTTSRSRSTWNISAPR